MRHVFNKLIRVYFWLSDVESLTSAAKISSLSSSFLRVPLLRVTSFRRAFTPLKFPLHMLEDDRLRAQKNYFSFVLLFIDPFMLIYSIFKLFLSYFIFKSACSKVSFFRRLRALDFFPRSRFFA